MSLLKMEKITYQYQKETHPVLNGVTATFEAGEVTSIIGPSGSGKTTVLSLLAALDMPTEGEVFYQGRNLQELDKDQYRREEIAMIFQSYQLFPMLTALENVIYVMEMLGISKSESKEKAKEILRRVGISEDKWNRVPEQLSGGEQQRVAIGRALSKNVKVILADEPTGNLDRENTQNIIDLLIRISHQDNICVVVVTHDPAIAKRSDKVYQMEDGILQVPDIAQL